MDGAHLFCERPLIHRFKNKDVEHRIEQYKCAIVASKINEGHVLPF